MPIIKNANWGGSRPGAGRKPRSEYESRELFKTAFDNVIDPESWENIIREVWESKNWNMIKFLIEQRIGKAVDIKEANQPKHVRIIIGEEPNNSTPEKELRLDNKLI